MPLAHGSQDEEPALTTAGREATSAKPDGELSAAQAVAIADNPGASRFELRVNGELAGYAVYEDTGSGRGFEHTAVAAKFQGRGLAGQMVAFGLDEARASARTVLPFCPFVRTFIKGHPEYVDLVEQPQRFGLAPTPDAGDAEGATSPN